MVGMCSCLYFDWRKLVRKPGTSLGGLRNFLSKNEREEPDRMDLSSGRESCLRSSLRDSKMCYCFLPFPLALERQHQGNPPLPEEQPNWAKPSPIHERGLSLTWRTWILNDTRKMRIQLVPFCRTCLERTVLLFLCSGNLMQYSRHKKKPSFPSLSSSKLSQKLVWLFPAFIPQLLSCLCSL